jgi:protein SCO1
MIKAIQLFGLITLCVWMPNFVLAGQIDPAPKEIQDVGIDEHAGDRLPLDLGFTNAAGKRVLLRDLIHDKPILLTLNYSNCPMLCSLQLNGLVQGLQAMAWSVGKEFDVITVSLDPKETAQRASETKKHLLELYGRASSEQGWHFLTGDESSIKTIAKAVGFRYQFIPDTGEYAHAPAVFVIAPSGVISRYLYGVVYEPKTVRLSLVEAAAGRLGSPLDKIILFCFHYDATKGRYAPVAQRVMRLGGLLAVMIFGVVLSGFWVRERKRALKKL